MPPKGAPTANAMTLAVRLIRNESETIPMNSGSRLPISASAARKACRKSCTGPV
jgi:hypothetical protein